MSIAAGGRRQQAEERREQILDAAVRVFAEKGYDGASMRDIAREVGVTEGLLYHYFQGKEQLMHACWTERSWQEHMERIFAASQGIPLGQVLRELLHDFFDTLRDNADMIRMCVMEMQRNSELAENYVERIERGQDRLIDFLRSRQAAGEIRADADLRIAGGLLMGTAHSMYLLWGRQEPEKWDPLVEMFVSAGVDIVLYGVAPQEDGHVSRR